MTIKVVYHDNTYDTIPAFVLQHGIDCKKIKMFYRNSERRWVTVGADPMRKTAHTLVPYAGPEKRAPQIFESPFLHRRIAFQLSEINRQLY
ncbi:MAG: GSU3473 family protein [Dissulfurispiraceae bacterium]|jgi:hypothetical protein